MEPITSFRGKYAFLSNFSPSPIIHEDATYPTAEHLFQAAKTLKPEEREWVRLQTSPGKAKRAGRKVTLRPDWQDIKVDTMLYIQRLKYNTYTHLATYLKNTGTADIAEGNNWGDRFWGQVDGQGANHLGHILMQVRDELNTRS